VLIPAQSSFQTFLRQANRLEWDDRQAPAEFAQRWLAASSATLQPLLTTNSPLTIKPTESLIVSGSNFGSRPNVLLDLATADSAWLPWSREQFTAAVAQGPVLINPIIYAELAPAFTTSADLDRWLDPAVFQRLPLPSAAGWVASQAWLKYRKAGGTKTSPLPDFYIDAHAEIESRTIVTRDVARYRSYFPNVALISPP
jgi:predicted nucleic acid-binding protein